MEVMPSFRSKRKLNRITIFAICLTSIMLLLISTYLLWVMYDAGKAAQKKATEFSELIENNKFAKAVSFYKAADDDMKGIKKDRTLKKLNKVLSAKTSDLSQKILDGAKDDTVLEDIKGLSLFKSEISDKVNSELSSIESLYINKSIGYKKAANYYKTMEAFAFSTVTVKKHAKNIERLSESRKSMSNAKKLMASKDYENAMQEFKKVIKADSLNYPAAIKGKKSCLKAMYPIYLKNAESYTKQYQFRAAYGLLTEALKYYPNDTAIKQKISECTEQEKKADSQLVPYNGTVEHIFFHPLIAYPELAFDNDNMSDGYNDWFVTAGEFKKIIQSIYDNNYVLIDINSLYEDTTENGKEVFKRAQLMLPKGKKPLVLSVDDINYYPYMIQNGDVYKLVLDKDGNVATYSKNPKGEDVISYDNEVVPIVDKFVEEHPDFSFRGAKGTLNLTGYQGILGYRTQNLTDPNYEKEKDEALRVVKRLKETGWNFASHSYGHPAFGKISYEKCVKDTDNWKKEVESLVGPTKIFVYPYGSRVTEKMTDPKFKYLYDAGFRFFCGVGARPYEKDTSNFILVDRRDVDGYTMNYRRDTFLPLYDSNKIIDRSVRPPFKPLAN